MRYLIAAVFTVAAFLLVNFGAFAQGAQPVGAQPVGAQPNPRPTPSSEYSYEEHGRYHPCPSSVRFNGRNACVGCPDVRSCSALPSDLTVH
jgi:hypothetical protein